MRLGLGGKLFLVSVVLIGIAGLASGGYLELLLRDWLSQRASMPLAQVDDLLGRVRSWIVLAGALGLALAVFMSALASRSLSRELAQERHRFGTVLAGMSEAVLAVDGDGRVTLSNPSAHALLDADLSPGVALSDAVHVPDLVQIIESGMEAPASAEFDIDATGNKKVLANAHPLRDNRGVVVTMHDVSEMRRLETVRKDFVANVSHELRTPVTIIQATAETMASGRVDDQDRLVQFAGAIHRNAERLSRIISDLLDLSRAEAGKFEIKLGVVNVDDALSRAIQLVERKAATRSITLSIKSQSGLLVRADQPALDQVLTNLTDNAVNYIPEGGHIVLRSRLRKGRTRIEVRDDGAGISEDHKARIFERFYRVDPGRSRDMGGTGLGLAIVKHLVESMDGEVGVRDNEPHGSVFWVDLPPITASAPPEQPTAELSPEASEPISRLRKHLLLMAGHVEQMIAQSIQALVQGDAELARRTIESDGRVNLAELEADDYCLTILDEERPVSTELRFVTLALKMVTDLERIGDLAVNICERAIDLSAQPQLKPYEDITRMAKVVQGMVHDAIDAFLEQDESKARDIITRDDEVDQLYTAVFRELLTTMMDDSEAVERGIHIQSIAKWLERMGDHSTNIAEQVIFMVGGQDIRHIGKLGH